MTRARGKGKAGRGVATLYEPPSYPGEFAILIGQRYLTAGIGGLMSRKDAIELRDEINDHIHRRYPRKRRAK